MADLQNQIIALRRQVSLLENTNVVFNTEPRNPNTQTVYVNSATGETKYWTGKEWVITSGTGGGGLTGWNTTVVFTATDYRTIAWTSGVVSIGTTDSKTDYATTSGNFTMAATTYFYWQADNPTAIQTTSTAGDVVIAGGVLIAVGRMNADTANLASLKVFGGPSVDQIIADEIVANSITSNMLQANSITASKLATTLLYAGAITLDTNGLIKGGQTAYNTGVGFFLGYSGGAYKFSIGNPAGDHLYWDGTNLVLSGSASLVGTLPWSSITDDGNAPADNATVGATWGTDLNSIPTTLTAPSGDGLYLSSTHMGYYSSGAFTSYIKNNGDFFFKGDAGSSIDWNVTTASTLTIKGKIQAGTGSVILSSYLSGEVPQGNINVANSGWNNTCVFSITDADTVAWSSGSLVTSTGTTYTISAGNTGNMVAMTYIYLDTATSTTVYQTTTTASNAVGAGKVLIAVAQNGTGEATFQTLGGTGLNINGANIVPATISSTELALLAVNTANIAANAITTAKIASGAVTAGELASGAVTTAKIAALAITSAEIAAGAITTAKIAADAVTAAEIATGAVGSNEIAAGAVIAGKITAGTIVAADIAAGTITGAKIAAGTITATNITAGTITATEIAALTITAANIAANTITAAKIVAGTITATEIAAGTITAAKIAAGTITATEIAAGTITATQILAGTITTTQIAALTITASNIAGATITGAKIAAGTITASNITAGTITANEIAASTITAGKMSVSTLSSIVADLGAITAGTIVLPTGGFIRSGQTAYNTGTGFYLGNDLGVTKFSIGIAAGNRMTWDGTTFSVNGVITTGAGSSIGSTYLSGAIPQSNLSLANRGWSQTCAFSLTDSDTVSWGAGTLVSADGTSYSISAGNTSNMTTKTYIFLDVNTSTTVYQITTTPSSAVGSGKVLVAVAQNGSVEATYTVLSGQGGQNINAVDIVAGSITANEIATGTITAGKIAAGTITANEIAASTITAGKLSISTLSSITANIGTITAGTITGVTVTGGTIQTSSGSGQRIVEDVNGLRMYDSSNYKRMEFGWSGTTAKFLFYDAVGAWCGELYGFSTGTYGAVINANSTSISIDNTLANGQNAYFCAQGTSYTARFMGKMRIPVGSNLY